MATKCHVCGQGIFVEPPSGKESYMLCNECGAIWLLYKPLPHQDDFHKDTHKIKAYFGGYGSGKTTAGAWETLIHVLNTPGGMTLIGAQTYPQLEQTAQKEFMQIVPDELVEDYLKQKNMMIMKNGHVVLFRTLDDEGKIRSLNLSMAWIEEASEVKYDIFVQLQTRLRNHATKHHQLILTSNPDMNWIKTEVLLKADKIHNPQSTYLQDPDEINKAISVHIAPTHLNPYLPDDFWDTVAKGKPDWWIRRYLYGSFEHTSGQVYPMFADYIIEPREIPKHWQRLFAADFGLRDPTVMLAGAIDPKLGELHIYAEHYEAGKSVKYHASKMKEMIRPVGMGLIRSIVGDPAGKRRSEKDYRSLFDHYAEYGLYFKPGLNKIEDGIMKVYGYFEAGKIKIHANCRNLIRELGLYKYPEQELDAKKNPSEIPIDKDNHTCDALRYMIAELPDDPDELINIAYFPAENYATIGKDQSHLPHALQDNPVNEDPMDWHAYY